MLNVNPAADGFNIWHQDAFRLAEVFRQEYVKAVLNPQLDGLVPKRDRHVVILAQAFNLWVPIADPYHDVRGTFIVNGVAVIYRGIGKLRHAG